MRKTLENTYGQKQNYNKMGDSVHVSKCEKVTEKGGHNRQHKTKNIWQEIPLY